MIQLPRRSVTRFFIPLVDVMTLLFCMFLLLPNFRESEPDNLDPVAVALKKKLDKSNLAVKQLEEEVRALRKGETLPLEQRMAIRVLEIDPKDGRLYYTERREVKDDGVTRTQYVRKYIDSAKEAETLILRHKRELRERRAEGQPVPELHYLFVFPREGVVRLSEQQRLEYEKWFAGVSHSSDRPGSTP
jgi:hypothetical protein